MADQPAPKKNDRQCRRIAESARAWLRLLEEKNAPEPMVMIVRAICAGLRP